jgi:AbrB family looped-hinge helix DNA binding protein
MAAVAHLLRIDAKGRIMLPAALRAQAHLQEGDELIAYVEDRRIILETRADVKARLRAQAAAARTHGDAVAGLLQDRLADLAAEEQRLRLEPDSQGSS